MCGILCSVTTLTKPNSLNKLWHECITQIVQRGPDFVGSPSTTTIYDYQISIAASVLWLQGDSISLQPVVSYDSIFAYNGDLFRGLPSNNEKNTNIGDTNILLTLLEDSINIIDTLANVHGPYAFIWLDVSNSILYFGRDVYGRRSLLVHRDELTGNILLASVAKRSHISFIEVPAIGIFSYSLKTNEFKLFTWPKIQLNFEEKLNSMNAILKCSINVIRTSMLLMKEFKSPEDSSLSILMALRGKSSEAGYNYLLSNDIWLNHVQQLKSKLENALQLRISTQPKYCKNCIISKGDCKHCRVGILFSGGVDCSILALISDQFIPANLPIDLINVAFDKVKDFKTPDRLTGIESWNALKRLRPKRQWNFLEVNVTALELEEARKTSIADLIFPLNTILDDSLGCALWFASRARTETYESPCRVLLVGMGADELFGGYTRHRAAYKNNGWSGLHRVLEEDWANIAHRNLARDDRVVSDHGRQLRTPYLDEEVVQYVQSLEVWEKTFPSSELEQGFGEKILLRTLAYHLGLRDTASFKKRALQFGSRIADKKENAHEVSPRLTTPLR